jgi:hypothetical protein
MIEAPDRDSLNLSTAAVQAGCVVDATKFATSV